VRTGGEAPVLNQIPFGPNDWDADLVAAHVERGVVVEGYSGFKRTDLRAPALVAAAQAHGVTVAQVVVRWHVQHDVVVIPKSKTPDRIAANIDVDGFALTVWGVRIRAWVADQR
jgi:2,5-diketo-D-gluconate reductase A